MNVKNNIRIKNERIRRFLKIMRFIPIESSKSFLSFLKTDQNSISMLKIISELGKRVDRIEKNNRTKHDSVSVFS